MAAAPITGIDFAGPCLFFAASDVCGGVENHCHGCFRAVAPGSTPFLGYTVWPEILAGRYFGGLLKICHLAEFTLAVEPGSAIMIFITKWLLKRAGILIGP